ncbi:ethyl tert-butyl ether degradation protein EthD [Polaribacter vadi]|uniref:Ethyl tert-butyl ether degradation protein EthD n=1 Tax=Polaribacter vadi TaxID=1774273 RepID=A0A1B8TYB7_9FLAO|nr:EthD family reductase [Polaribacter vadi]AOW16504.1 ethyl tert-butyl ether degradation protein EthD [Polaribacter vadi]OBY64590.1 ethyl tert-butyl ether degradation protein EthD [Polaribacter vadi]
MIKVSVLYPNSKDIQFDAEYYKNTHLPMITKLVGSALKGLELDLGIGSRVPGEPAPYVAIAHLKFESVVVFQESFGPHAAVFAADVKNYTNVQGVLQISELIPF